ncbi:MAG: hypothetical protein AB1714_13775 [Acidobacteriota bacterium]
MEALGLFLKHLRQPEYVHVLLNPLPVYGLAMGVVGMVVAFILRERRAMAVALAVVFVGALSAWPVVFSGHRGYDRVYAMSGEDAQQWLDVHEERAESFLPLYLTTAALAAVAFFSQLKWPRLGKPVTWLVLLLALASLGAGGWISQAGGQVRHSEFRDGPPPADAAAGHEEEHQAR